MDTYTFNTMLIWNNNLGGATGNKGKGENFNSSYLTVPLPVPVTLWLKILLYRIQVCRCIKTSSFHFHIHSLCRSFEPLGRRRWSWSWSCFALSSSSPLPRKTMMQGKRLQRTTQQANLFLPRLTLLLILSLLCSPLILSTSQEDQDSEENAASQTNSSEIVGGNRAIGRSAKGLRWGWSSWCDYYGCPADRYGTVHPQCCQDSHYCFNQRANCQWQHNQINHINNYYGGNYKL